MILEGDTSVIDALKEKKRLMDAGEDSGHIRPLLVIGGGCMQGGYAWGAALAFADMGYQDCFHTVVGISVGALSAAYLVSGNITSVESLPYVEGVSGDFFALHKPFNILNTKFMRTVLESHPERSLQPEQIFKSPTKLAIGISKYPTATPYVLYPQNPEQLFEGMRATISMAGAVSDAAVIDGVRYIDGETTSPYIRTCVYDIPGTTHILDLTNQDKGGSPYSYLEAFLLGTLYRAVTTPAVRKAANDRRVARSHFLQQAILKQELPTCVAWGDGSIGGFEANRAKMKAVVENSRHWWTELLK